jgi:UDP-N-acetylmuramyl pentapeptide phosphotransferase/UDP-N-acetylglucosamine-1-phosphate transferase
VPYLGGVGVACGLTVPVAIARPWLLAPFLLALALGTTDDIHPLSPTVRLGAQCGIGLCLAATLPAKPPAGIGFVLIAMAAVALMNGVNLIDGLDALCASVTIAAAAGFAVVLDSVGRGLALGLAGATVGFLRYNAPRARVYLGDGGSYLLGTALAALLGLSWSAHQATQVGLAALLLVTVPVAELGLAAIRRMRSGRSPLHGDRNHPYDQLVRRGWSQMRVALVYGAGTLACAIFADLASRLRLWAAALLVVATWLGILGLSWRAGFIRPHRLDAAEGSAA